MARGREFLVTTNDVVVLDPYWFWIRDQSPPVPMDQWAGHYPLQGDRPSYVGFRYSDIVRWRGEGGHHPARDHQSVFSVDGGSIAIFDVAFLETLHESFDAETTGAVMVHEANKRIAEATGYRDAILLLRGAMKGRGQFVGDGEYYFAADAFRVVRPA